MCLRVSVTLGSTAAQNTADISGHSGKHSGTERNSGNVFFFKPCNRCKMLLRPIPAPENS